MTTCSNNTYRAVFSTIVLLGLLFPTQQQAFGQPEVARVAFTRPADYRNHVDIQPQGDHHRVRVFVHFKDMAGKQGFARMTYGDAADIHLHPKGVSVHRCDIADASEVWVFYFRVPRFNQDNMTYQIDVGEFIPDAPTIVYDGYAVSKAFQYTIRRDAGGTARFEPPLGPVNVQIQIIRTIAAPIGGTVEVISETFVTDLSLRYGVSQSRGLLNGHGVAWKIGG